MTCFLNLYQSLTVLAIFILVWYLLVFLPQDSPVLRVILCLMCSFVTYGVLASFFPDQAPTDPWVVTATTIIFMIFFWFVASSLFEGFFLLAALLVAFPVAIAAQNSLADWIELETGVWIGKTGVLVLLLLLVLLVVAIGYKFQDVQVIQDIGRSILFSLLAMVAIRFLAILGDEGNPKEFCCSTSAETRTCPVAFGAVYIILFVFLFLFRMVFTMYYRDKSKQLKEECSCCCRWWQEKKRKRKGKQLNKDKVEEQPLLLSPHKSS